MRYKIYFFVSVIFIFFLLLSSFDKTPEYFIHKDLQFQWETSDDLSVPESVCYDETRDHLYVSNISGDPSEKDGNGFISIVTTDGDIFNPEWVTGLDAPKGMGIYDDKLFVTDIDKLRVIDLASGNILESYHIEGASFLNDITVLPTGDVYISDMKTNRIYRFKNGNVEMWLANHNLKGINGLFATDEYLYAGIENEILRIDYSTKRIYPFVENTGGIDGLEQISGDSFLFSDWQGRVYRVDSGGEIEKLMDSRTVNKNAADIEFIQGRNLLYVPTFMGNTVTSFKLSEIP